MKATPALSRRRLLALGAGLATVGTVGGFGKAVAGPDLGQIPRPTAGGSQLIATMGIVADPWQAKVRAAGYVTRSARINQVDFSYVEGPDNGPPLVLLHAQQLDWFGYSRVLPELSKKFHVFDIDYPGHGNTITPAGYPMTANRIGADLAAFMQARIGQPAFVTGNSSGGLLTAWLAANQPQQVISVLLEDPPLFASEYPRIKKTIAYRDFASCATAVDGNVRDFLLFWIQDNKAFFDENVGPGVAALLAQAVIAYRLLHPGQPIDLGLITDDTVRLFLRGLNESDPRFGKAFYDGTWNAGFDHATALRKITCPALLLQANYSWVDGDILNGAMSEEDADTAMSLLADGTYQKVDATHVINLDEPQQFVTALEGFFR
ncbi:alpha/beta hydrolase [Actinoplanes sp. NPDC026619]|uniref:alpha/beta fold hydrolase n=1 Tax=Actinoplanes sp. NPDC026619 TaxID=3155798 RepID=UPI0033D23004